MIDHNKDKLAIVSFNKRGDIPITILVIGVFAICAVAMLSFISSSIKIKDSFVGISKVEEANLKIETNLINNLPANFNFPLKIEGTRWVWSWNPLALRKKIILFSIDYRKVS